MTPTNGTAPDRHARRRCAHPPHGPISSSETAVVTVEPWYSVRCLFRLRDRGYEERITLWRAMTFDEAIERAEAEAQEYAAALSAEYLGLAQGFHLATEHVRDGDEVF